MSPAVATPRVAVALVMSLVVLSACGDKKAEKKAVEVSDAAPIAAPPPPPPPDKERSFLASGCEQHVDAAKKSNCLCRVDVMDQELGSELLAKLQTAPKDGPSDAVVEHLGGLTNLSRVYEAMGKATQQCETGASE